MASGEYYRRALVRVRSMPYEELVRGRSDDKVADIQKYMDKCVSIMWRLEKNDPLLEC